MYFVCLYVLSTVGGTSCGVRLGFIESDKVLINLFTFIYLFIHSFIYLFIHLFSYLFICI